MTEERKKQIKEEAERRIELWLSNSSFDEMTFYGSYILFNMAIGSLGSGLKKDWMNENDFVRFVTYDEFNSVEYDEIMRQLFRDCKADSIRKPQMDKTREQNHIDFIIDLNDNIDTNPGRYII